MVQPSPELKYHFLPSASRIVQRPVHNKQEGTEDKHSNSQDSKSKRRGSKGICDKVQPRGCFNPELIRWGSLYCLSQRIAFRRFNFSLIESKDTTLADALRKAQDFIQAIEICNGDDFVWQDT